MNFLMNELPQIRPVLFVQAGNVVSVDVGEVGFRHGSCAYVPSTSYPKVGRDAEILQSGPKSLKTKRSRPAIRHRPEQPGFAHGVERQGRSGCPPRPHTGPWLPADSVRAAL